MLKINLSPGLRFNASITTSALLDLDIDFNIYTSAPKSKWPFQSQNRVFFRPMPFKVLEYLTKINRNRELREKDAIIFDKLVSISSRRCDIFHGWASFSLDTAKLYKKKHNTYFILDRACPHIEFQESLLLEEADLVNYKYNRVSKKFLDRCIREYDLADQIIVPSVYSYNSFINKGFKKDKIKILRLNASFIPKKRKIYNKINTKFIVGTIGGNHLRKGIKYLVDAWQCIKLLDAKLLIKSSENELKKHHDLYNKIKNDKTIEIIPYVKDIEDFYVNCDLFCLPSVDDGFGMVVLEAMACGLPVITTKNVGASEMISNGVTGLIGEKRDINFLAENILKCYSDKSLLEGLASNSYEFYKKLMKSKNNYSKKIIEIYNTLDKD